MRKYYIDNLRILCILLLFPFHTSMVFNSFGEPFYVHSASVKLLSLIPIAVYPWWMTLLFTVAGVSSAYALQKRSGKAYAKERFSKLLIPFLSGLLLIIPVQTYIADLTHNGYNGGYFSHYSIFFTKITDLTGYDGGLTPAHTWFMLYLFVISMVTLPLMLWYKRRNSQIDGNKISMPILLSMFFIITLMTPILEIGGKSIGQSLACFLIGFFIISLDEVQDQLMKYRIPLSIFWVILIMIRIVMYLNHHGSGLVWDIEQLMLTWAGILALLGLGKKHLNFNNKFTAYFSPAAFPIYYFHQSVLVVVAYLTVKVTNIIPVQFMGILILSLILTLLCYELFRRFNITCYLFGIKK